MKHRLAQIGIAVIGMLLCAVVAGFLPPPWEGVSGRDFRPQATTMAGLLLVLSVLFRGRLGWRLLNLIITLFLVEIITLIIIGHFSGYTGYKILDSFNLEWLAYMNLFTGLPWLLGLGAGSIWCFQRGKSKQHTDDQVN